MEKIITYNINKTYINLFKIFHKDLEYQEIYNIDICLKDIQNMFINIDMTESDYSQFYYEALDFLKNFSEMSYTIKRTMFSFIISFKNIKLILHPRNNYINYNINSDQTFIFSLPEKLFISSILLQYFKHKYFKDYKSGIVNLHLDILFTDRLLTNLSYDNVPVKLIKIDEKFCNDLDNQTKKSEFIQEMYKYSLYPYKIERFKY